MIDLKSQTTKTSGFRMPVSGHHCAVGVSGRETTVERDRARTDVVMGLAIAYTGDAFPGPDAWSPPI